MSHRTLLACCVLHYTHSVPIGTLSTDCRFLPYLRHSVQEDLTFRDAQMKRVLLIAMSRVSSGISNHLLR